MIRINLLAVERQRSKKTRVLIPAAHRVTIGATVVLMVGLSLMPIGLAQAWATTSRGSCRTSPRRRTICFNRFSDSIPFPRR